MDPTQTLQSAIATRRGFLKTLGVAGVSAMFTRLARAQAPATPDKANFVFTRLQYDRGDWNSDMLTEGMLNGSEVNLLNRLNHLGNIQALQDEYYVRADSEKVFEHPFLYATGHGDCDFTTLGRENIRRILENGGFLLGDNCSGAKDVGFDRSFKTQMQLMFPEKQFEQLPLTHPVFSSYFKIEKVQGGDKLLDPFLEGLEVGGRTAVIYTRNDLGCAWEGHICSPGGESQRNHAFEMGMNIVYYALSGL